MLEFFEINSRYIPIWTCQCECGNKKNVGVYSLMNGDIKSCGCLQKEYSKNHGTTFKTHGQSRTRIYRQYRGLMDRCYRIKSKNYRNYGGRGITVCEEWKNDFVNYYDWALENGYSDSLTIDRIDNEKGYSPKNCKFSNNLEQQNNKRNNINFIINGVSKSILEWSKISGIKINTIYTRYYRGITGKNLLNPVQKRES